MVYGDAERCADGVLAAIAFANRIFLLIVGVEIKLEVIDDFTGLFRQAVLAHKRHDRAFNRRKGFRKMKHHTAFTAFESLLLIGRAKHAQEHTVNSD